MNERASAAACAVVAARVRQSGRASGGIDAAATTQPAMIAGVAAGVEVRPLLSVNDKVGNYRSRRSRTGSRSSNQGKNVHLYVNHETSLVPFPVGLQRLHELARQQARDRAEDAEHPARART